MFNSLDDATRHARNTFTKPGLADRAYEVQLAMHNNEPLGTHGFAELKSMLIEESEYLFEQQIAPYPHVVVIPRDQFKTRISGDPSPRFGELEGWLALNVPAEEYLAFPGNASGQYKNCFFNVYFKDVKWATYFKLACV